MLSIKLSGRSILSRKSLLLLVLFYIILRLISKLAEVLTSQTDVYHVESKKIYSEFDNNVVAGDIWHQDPKNSKTWDPVWKKLNGSKMSEPVSKFRKSWRELSILCIVHTCAKHLDTRTKYVKETWAKLCNKTLYVSDSENSTFPTINVTQRSGFHETWAKTRKEMQLLYSEYIDKYDWFFKADDDTYVIMNNLRKFLLNKNSSEPKFYGKLMANGFSKEGYHQGGAGYAFGKEALKRLVEVGFQKGKRCRNETFGAHGDDRYLALCLVDSGVKLMKDCFDSSGREIFHASTLWQQVIYQNSDKVYGYKYSFHKDAMKDCCSKESISFHKVYGRDHIFMHFIWTNLTKTD